jgi:hypothetical protein
MRHAAKPFAQGSGEARRRHEARVLAQPHSEQGEPGLNQALWIGLQRATDFISTL